MKISSPNKRIKLSYDCQSNQPLINTIQQDDDDDAMFNDDISLAQIEKATAQALLQRQVSNSDDLFDDIPIEELVQALDRQEDRSPQGITNTVVVNESLGILSRASSSTTAVTVTEEKTMVTEIKKPVPAEGKRKKFTRYLVANITTNTFEISDRVVTEKVLTLIQEDSNTAITARLRDDWLQTTISVGNVVHIPFTNNTTEVIIDQRKNFIIVHPDRLISCTTVAESYHCLRRSILQTKIRGVTECTEALVHGSILHRVLQNALLTGDFSIKSIKEEMEQIVASSLEDLYTLDVDEKTTLEALNQYVESIHEFGSMFVGNEPKPKARVSSDKGPDAAKALGCETVAISKVLDIEEHLWSPTYGLKGMIDASVQLKMSPINRVLTVPFELKTGKSSKFLTNRAQTVLYTLLMSDRYDIDIGAGILYYSKTNSLYLVPALRNEVASMIIARNELASALYSRQMIPPMIKNFHTCQYCCLADACTIYHKAIEKGNGVSSGLYKLFEERTNHMTTKTSSFFKHWWQLLDKEELDIDYLRKEIWSQPAEEREKSGRCISNLKLDIAASEILPEIAQWKYCFVRAEPDKPLFCNLSIGDPVVVSSMEGHISLAMGHVSSLTADEIILGLNEPLRSPPKRSEDFDLLNNQQFQTFIRYRADVEKHYKDNNVLYRIDKDEMSTAMNMLRYNLVSLVANTGDERIQRLRELIIDLEKPAFDTTVVPTMPISSHLNPDQRNVMTKVLQAKDYNLILGMPGTGKTTTTAEIIKYLVGMNKTILVTAFTHTALDNVLSKVRDQGIDVLRLGNIDKVMQSMKDCVPALNRSITTVEEMKAFYDSKRVVGITCLGIGHAMLQKKHFDYCIIDEASQITLPMCIGPIRYADRFILVGDLYQLPPIVRDTQAGEKGLKKSLFAILAEAHPESISRLEYQYRMNKDIMQVANILVYDGKLKCGNHSISTKSLSIPHFEHGLKLLHASNQQCIYPQSNCWIHDVLDPRKHVVFVNTDLVPANETREFGGSYLHNEKEGKLIYQVTESLLRCGIKEEQLAIVSVYRSQLRTISRYFEGETDIEIATIDKYQGRDKDCVIISLVRSNTQGNCGDLLRDWRRLNVAITRAKHKLVLVGSVSTLRVSSPYCQLLDMLEKKGWIYTLPRDSEKIHDNLLQVKNTTDKQRKHKVFTGKQAILKKNEILQNIHECT